MIQQIYTIYPPRQGPHPPLWPPTMKYGTGAGGSDTCDPFPCNSKCVAPGQPLVPDPNNPSYCPDINDHVLPPAPCPYADLNPV